jgi:hypothetical protein
VFRIVPGCSRAAVKSINGHIDPMSSQINAVADVVRTSAQLVDKLESAFDDLGVSDKIPTVREAQREFVKSLLTYRDTVLQDVLAHTMALHSRSSI